MFHRFPTRNLSRSRHSRGTLVGAPALVRGRDDLERAEPVGGELIVRPRRHVVAPLEEALAEERRAVLASMGTKDQHEGMMAFLQKRKPEFNQ